MNNIILKIDSVEKSFGIKKIHQGVNIELKAGERLGLLGSSGTGKSVLLRSIIGLEHIDKGHIYFKDQEIQDLSEKEYAKIRTKISYSFQSGALFDSMTVGENLAFPLMEHTNLTLKQVDSKIDEMLSHIGLEGLNDLMPSDLSGGMQKRVGMARSMILNPDIILYDEPTAGLDPTNTINVVRLMKKFSTEGVSSIFVTHDIPAAKEFCNRIVIIDHGKIVFNGDIEEFSTSKSKVVQKFLINEGLNNAN